MVWVQRLFAFLAGLLSAGFGIVLLAAAAGWVPADWLVRPLDFLLAAWRLHLWGIGFVSLGIGLATLVNLGGRDRREDPVVTETELGRVAISRRAVEKLVEMAAMRADGVREVAVDLHQDQQGLMVSLILKVEPEVRLPDVANAVQTGVESYLRETGGLEARKVNVEIRHVAGDEKRREVPSQFTKLS